MKFIRILLDPFHGLVNSTLAADRPTDGLGLLTMAFIYTSTVARVSFAAERFSSGLFFSEFFKMERGRQFHRMPLFHQPERQG